MSPANKPCATDETTPDQREARLEQMSIARQVRLTHETPDQREGHIEQVSLTQHMRLTHRTPDQRRSIHICPFIAQEILDSMILEEHHVTRKLLIE